MLRRGGGLWLTPSLFFEGYEHLVRTGAVPAGNQMEAGVSGCLIAGGKSRRMGRDKRFLSLEGETLVQRILRILDGLFPEVIVVLAHPVPQLEVGSHRIVYDEIPDCGSLGGLYTGLTRAQFPRIFATAGDMPFLNPTVIRYLVETDRAADVVGVRLDTAPQPLHAVYNKTCLPILKEMASSGHLKIQDLFTDHRLRVKLVPEADIAAIDPALLSFRNINTPEEYDLAKAVAAALGSP